MQFLCMIKYKFASKILMDFTDPSLLMLSMTVMTLLNTIILIGLLILRKNQSSTGIKDGVVQNGLLIQSESRNNRRELLESLDQHKRSIHHTLSESQKSQSYLLSSIQNQVHQLIQTNDTRIESLRVSTQKALNDMRTEVKSSLLTIQKDNQSQLSKIRDTVDEKLHKTLEDRLGRSFKIVTESLERVQKGLGEMQSLANGVGDLKKVLTNVKTRGVLGEIQLGNILEQILSREQYEINVSTIPDSSNHVEFAIKFPGKDADDGFTWLPIDAKFPMDRYEQVLQAYEYGTSVEIDKAQKQLIQTVKLMARDIRVKYISPPHTTDFGILFLPVEGLYAEVVRHPGLLEELQRNQRIMIAGPSNLAAFLNSLQMGFQSIAIEKRSSEVWKILGAVKTEFGKFGEILAKTKKKLVEATNVIDQTGVRTRAIERKLRNVEELPSVKMLE